MGSKTLTNYRDAIRAFLRVSTDLIDLSGRINFHLRDGVIFASLASAWSNPCLPAINSFSLLSQLPLFVS